MDDEKMVDEETGEISDGYIQITGTCAYCQQSMLLKWPVGMTWSTEIADHAATERCTCRDAQTRINICAREMAAKRIIEAKFGQGCDDENALDYETVDLLTKIAFEVAKEKIEKATFNLGNGIKCSISLSNSGKIKIKRTRTKEETDEV